MNFRKSLFVIVLISIFSYIVNKDSGVSNISKDSVVVNNPKLVSAVKDKTKKDNEVKDQKILKKKIPKIKVVKNRKVEQVTKKFKIAKENTFDFDSTDYSDESKNIDIELDDNYNYAKSVGEINLD